MPHRVSCGGACAPPAKPSKRHRARGAPEDAAPAEPDRRAGTVAGLPGSLAFLIAFVITALLTYSVACLLLDQLTLAIIAATAACGLATTAVRRLVVASRTRQGPR
jgi:Flp pilus assembly protein TadB